MKTGWKSHGKGTGVISKVRASDGKRIYYIRYSYQGKRIIEKCGTKYETALGRFQLRNKQLEDPTYKPPAVEKKRRTKMPTFAAFCEQFMALHASKRKSEKTFFRPMVRQLCKTFGSKRMNAITQLEIERSIADRLKSAGPGTVNHHIGFLKLLFTKAIKWGVLPKDSSPAADVEKLKVPPPKPEDEARRFLTVKQTDRLIDAASDRIVPIIQLALLTGMRRGELLRLTWPQIQDGMIRLHETKSGKERRLPVTAEIQAVLKQVRVEQQQGTVVDLEQHVFLYRGKPMQGFKRSWEVSRKRAGLPRTRFHDLRHTWASRLLAAGVPLLEVMKLGGWSDVKMLISRYGHFSPASQLAAMESLSGTVADIPNVTAN